MAISRVSYTLPLLHTQLGYPVSGSTDCAVRTAQSAIEFGTWGQESPPPEVLRPKMGAKPEGGTSISQALRGIRTYGIDPLKYPSLNRGPIAQVREWLEAGHYVGLYGNYGAIIDGWRPLAGSKTYRGGHALGLFGFDNGKVLDFDPLYDGRRDNIPKGPTLVPFEMLAAFTGSMSGAARATAYAVPLDARFRKAVRALATEMSAHQRTQAELETTKASLAECQAQAPDCSECEQAVATLNQQLVDERVAHDETRAKLATAKSKGAEIAAL
jgi:hypothetical protein